MTGTRRTRTGRGRILGIALAAGCTGPDPAPHDTERETATDPCPTGQVLDGDTCVPEACGVGPWGDLPVDGDTVYVDATAASGGDGTEAAPFSTIQAGADAADGRGGGLVAVAAGTYVENLELGDTHDGVTVAGRCAELVGVDGSEAEAAVVTARGDRRRPDLGLAGLTLTAGPVAGLWVEHSRLTATDLGIHDNTAYGAVVADADVTLERVAVTGTLPTADGSLGRGVHVESGAQVSLSDVLVEANTEVGVFASETGTRVTLADGTIRDTRPAEDGRYGRGLNVQQGAAIDATRVRIEGNSEAGVYVSGEDSSLDLVDSAVNTTHAHLEANGNGTGLFATSGATVHLSGVELTGNEDVGLLVVGEGTRAVVQASEVADTRAIHAAGGLGVVVQQGAWASLDAATVHRNAAAGLVVTDAGTMVDLTDAAILDTPASATAGSGGGLDAYSGSTVTVDGGEVRGNHGAGVLGIGAGTIVELAVVTVTETGRGPTGGVAVGVASQEGADVSVEGGLVSATEGPGLYVADGGSLVATSAVVENNTFAGALLTDGTLTLSGCSVRHTGADAELGGGIGVYATSRFGAPALLLTGSEVGPHPYAAVWLDGPGTYLVTGNDLSGSEGVLLGGWPAHGNAVFAKGVPAWDGTTGLLLDGDTFQDAGQVAVFLHDASATFGTNTWKRDAEDLRQQHCADVAPIDVEAVPGVTSATICPPTDLLFDLSLDFTTLYLPETGPEP